MQQDPVIFNETSVNTLQPLPIKAKTVLTAIMVQPAFRKLFLQQFYSNNNKAVLEVEPTSSGHLTMFVPQPLPFTTNTPVLCVQTNIYLLFKFDANLTIVNLLYISFNCVQTNFLLPSRHYQTCNCICLQVLKPRDIQISTLESTLCHA